MGQVILSAVVKSKLGSLVDILYSKNYFGFKDSAREYVLKLKEFIYTIPYQTKSKTKKPKHGAYYARFVVKNKRTQYYITYNIKDDRYLIKNIFTSHESGYATYIRGVK